MAVKPKKRVVSKPSKMAKASKSSKAKVVKRTKAKPAKAAATKKTIQRGSKKVVKKSPIKSSKKTLTSKKKIAQPKSKKVAAKVTKTKASVSKGIKKKVTSGSSAAKSSKAIGISKSAQKPAAKISATKKPEPKKTAASQPKAKPKKLAIVEFSGKKIEVPKKKQLAPLKALGTEEQVQVSSLVGMDIHPYQESPGEEYMNERQHEHFRKILGKWKSQLLEEMDRTMHHLQDEAANFPDPNDRATQEEEFSLELRARDRERKLIKKIEEAVQKIDAGEYGYCDSCGVEIGIRRLEARPTANLCIDCKTLDEIRERQLWG